MLAVNGCILVLLNLVVIALCPHYYGRTISRVWLMEHPTERHSSGRMCAFARLELPRLQPVNGYAHIDEEGTGKLHLHAYSYETELVKIAEATIVVRPGPSRGMEHRIHYLASVVGRRICVTYLNPEKKTVFELYEADQDSHRLNLLKSCLIEVDKHGPTAIMAINDRCFLGFGGCSGVVDLTKEKLEVDLFHKFTSVGGKSIDAFGYNGGKSLFAVDDMKWPKYAYFYDISGKPKKKGSKVSLPNGINEIYEDCVKVDGEIALRSHYSMRGGSGNNIYVLSSGGTVNHSCKIQVRHGSIPTKKNPRFTSLGYLQDGVVLLVGNYEHETIIDGCVHYLPKKEIKGVVESARKLKIGDRCQDVVTVKDKQIGHVLATKNGNSIIAEVRWKKDELEIVRELVVNDQAFDRLFMEM